MIQNTHESIYGAVGRRVSISLMGNTWENVLFSIVLYHNPPGSRNMVNSYYGSIINCCDRNWKFSFTCSPPSIIPGCP